MASGEWIKFNEDSKAKNNRAKYVAEHGGEFVKGSKGWEWRETKTAVKATQTTKTKKIKAK
jgi:hypothetical protein